MPLTKAAAESKTVAGKLCRCIAAVRASAPKTRGRRAVKRATKKAQGRAAESRAIAICVAAVLQKKRGRTLKRFSCSGAKPVLSTQAPLKK
jgi:hypothetical protein